MSYNTRNASELKYKFTLWTNDHNEKTKSDDVSNVQEFATSQFKLLFTNNVLSASLFKPGTKRDKNHFLSAQGAILDFDGTLNLEDAIDRLDSNKLPFYLITSKSHHTEKKPGDCYHIYIPFSRTIHSRTDYERVYDELLKLFREADHVCRDASRFFFASPEDAEDHANWLRPGYDVDARSTSSKGKSTKAASPNKATGSAMTRISDAWDDSLDIQLDSGETVKAIEINKHTQIMCPFHDDNNSSAFIDYSDNSSNHYISCSACAKTFWHTETQAVVDTRYKDYWAHGGSIYKSSFTGMEFSFQKIGTEMFYAQTGLVDNAEQAKAYTYLSTKKYLHSLGQIHSLGDINAIKPYYQVDQAVGVTKVHIPGIENDIDDGKFITDWLKETFGKYFDFIMEYLAVYSYTNYVDSPTIVLLGERGTGKNTFADLVGDIYSCLAVPIRSLSDSFNDYATKKLLVIDEVADDENRISYTQLKKLSGQTEFEVNRKYQPTYKAPNNLNIILLSNNKTPFRLKTSEFPPDEYNNQFFVYEMPTFKGMPDPNFKKKLNERLGCFVRNELKHVFEGLTLTGRYSIRTPITNELKNLFDSSKGELDYAFEELVSDIIDVRKGVGDIVMLSQQQNKWIEAGFIPSKLLEDTANQKGVSKSALIRRFKEENVVIGNSTKHQIVNERCSGYHMNASWAIANGIAKAPANDSKPKTTLNQTTLDVNT